jgi:hypothetical protein
MTYKPETFIFYEEFFSFESSIFLVAKEGKTEANAIKN